MWVEKLTVGGIGWPQWKQAAGENSAGTGNGDGFGIGAFTKYKARVRDRLPALLRMRSAQYKREDGSPARLRPNRRAGAADLLRLQANRAVHTNHFAVQIAVFDDVADQRRVFVGTPEP